MSFWERHSYDSQGRVPATCYGQMANMIDLNWTGEIREDFQDRSLVISSFFKVTWIDSPNGGHLSPEKVTYESKRSHLDCFHILGSSSPQPLKTWSFHTPLHHSGVLLFIGCCGHSKTAKKTPFLIEMSKCSNLAIELWVLCFMNCYKTKNIQINLDALFTSEKNHV